MKRGTLTVFVTVAIMAITAGLCDPVYRLGWGVFLAYPSPFPIALLMGAGTGAITALLYDILPGE